MKTEQINNKEEWESFYYYSPNYKPKKYPKEYPCLAKMVTEGGGIVGEYEAHYVCYFPATQDPRKAFLAGISRKWEYIC
jgi:hypothetical protein